MLTVNAAGLVKFHFYLELLFAFLFHSVAIQGDRRDPRHEPKDTR